MQTDRFEESGKVFKEAIDLSKNFENAESEDRISVIRSLLLNFSLFLSAMESKDELQLIMDHLRNLGLKDLPRNAIWLDEEEEELIALWRMV